MGPVSASVTVDAPRERLFELLLDLSNRPAFYGPLASEIRLIRTDPVGVGSGLRLRLDPLGEYVDTRIRAAEAPHTIREAGTGGTLNRVPNHTVWELAEGPAPGTTEVTMSFWTEPQSLFERLRDPVRSTRRLRRAMGRALAGLREVVEGGEPVERLEVAGRPRLPC